MMRNAARPVLKHSLSDDLAQRIRALIRDGGYHEGDRLPTIMEMARRFGVGHPTVREALKKLQAIGVVEILHGSGVYVSRNHDVLVLANADYAGRVTKELLLDVVQARIPLELQSVTLGARHATEGHLQEMRRLLSSAGESLANDDVLDSVDMTFHRQIGLASGNTVLAQLLDAVRGLFVDEQRLILDVFGSRRRDHEEHLAILAAMEKGDEPLAAERMRAHLRGVQEVILQWDPESYPVIRSTAD